MIFILHDLITHCKLDEYNEIHLYRRKIAHPWHFVICMFHCRSKKSLTSELFVWPGVRKADHARRGGREDEVCGGSGIRQPWRGPRPKGTHGGDTVQSQQALSPPETGVYKNSFSWGSASSHTFIQRCIYNSSVICWLFLSLKNRNKDSLRKIFV